MSLLHQIGGLLRDALLHVPLEVVRGLFVLLPAALLVWVLRLPASEVTPPGAPRSIAGNLRLWAAVALGIQIVVYLVL